MSQQARITSLRFEGAPVLTGCDAYGNPVFSHDPRRVAYWMCDGWRFRYNQRRGGREIYTPMKDDTGAILYQEDGKTHDGGRAGLEARSGNRTRTPRRARSSCG